jgi:hypothetical protein
MTFIPNLLSNSQDLGNASATFFWNIPGLNSTLGRRYRVASLSLWSLYRKHKSPAPIPGLKSACPSIRPATIALPRQRKCPNTTKLHDLILTLPGK